MASSKRAKGGPSSSARIETVNNTPPEKNDSRGLGYYVGVISGILTIAGVLASLLIYFVKLEFRISKLEDAPEKPAITEEKLQTALDCERNGNAYDISTLTCTSAPPVTPAEK